MDINRIQLWGVISAVERFYDANDNEMYKGIMTCKRKSGVKDSVLVMSDKPMPTGHVRVSGQIRSRRNEGRLEVYVVTQQVTAGDYTDANEVVVEGYVCSQPFYKQTSTKELTQFLICIEGIRKSYLSVLVWDKTEFVMGDKLAICGRLQSRRFIKDGSPVQINELSAHRMPVICQQEWQQIC